MRDSWSPDDVFLELMPDGLDFVLKFDLDPFQMNDLVLDILEEVSARHWWVATRLIGCVTQAWDVIGADATLQGVDAGRLSLAAWLDVMLMLIVQRLKPDAVAMFSAQLEAPPVGEELPVEEMTMTESQFLSMAD